MSIADKIRRAKDDLDAVYGEGYGNGFDDGKASVPAPVIRELNVSANGTYTAPNGVNGYSPVVVSVPDINGSYNEGYNDGLEAGKVEGGGGGELVAALAQSSLMFMNGFATTPFQEGSVFFNMANNESWNFCSFYGSVRPGEKYKIELTRISGYDYWNTFLFSVGDWSTLIEPATNANVLKHVIARDENTYEVTIPEGCVWFNVNFNNQGTCVIYKLN